MNASPQFAVVIPYFQRDPGLLRAAVESVLAQRGEVGPLRIIVVDDGSPLPAADALGHLAGHPDLHVERQANAGPGAARNRGLDLVPPGTSYVAFLDSDDRWEPGLLVAAQRAFDAGCGLFFANSRRFGAAGTRFDWAHASGRRLDPDQHDPIDPAQGLYCYSGDFFDFAVYRSGIISTSTLVFRRDAASALRFATHLFNGQDRYFKLQLAQQVGPAAFSTLVYATEGRGVNIFDSSRWGSDNSLNLLHSYIRLARLVLDTLPLDRPQRAFVSGQLRQYRQSVASNVLHQLRRGVPLNWSVLKQTFAADPPTAAFFLPNLLRAVLRRLSQFGAGADSGERPKL